MSTRLRSTRLRSAATGGGEENGPVASTRGAGKEIASRSTRAGKESLVSTKQTTEATIGTRKRTALGELNKNVTTTTSSSTIGGGKNGKPSTALSKKAVVANTTATVTGRTRSRSGTVTSTVGRAGSRAKEAEVEEVEGDWEQAEGEGEEEEEDNAMDVDDDQVVTVKGRPIKGLRGSSSSKAVASKASRASNASTTTTASTRAFGVSKSTNGNGIGSRKVPAAAPVAGATKRTLTGAGRRKLAADAENENVDPRDDGVAAEDGKRAAKRQRTSEIDHVDPMVSKVEVGGRKGKVGGALAAATAGRDRAVAGRKVKRSVAGGVKPVVVADDQGVKAEDDVEVEVGRRVAAPVRSAIPSVDQFVGISAKAAKEEEIMEDFGVEEEEEVKVKPAVEGEEEEQEWEDLDVGDEDDPLMCSLYVKEVYAYLRELEVTTMPEPGYMVRQEELTWQMRGILVDWLIDVHHKFRLLPETVFLAVNIVDRFLTKRKVFVGKLQLVGIAALFIASKFEEVICPSVDNFLYMADGGYETEDVLKAERYVLQVVEFNLSYPNPINFLRRISKADAYDIQSRTIAKYFMEMSCVDEAFLDVVPSLIAAAAMWLSRKVLDRGDWDANLIHYSGYTEYCILAPAQKMIAYVYRNARLGAVGKDLENPQFFKKYASKKFYKSSDFVENWAQEEFGPAETSRPREWMLREWDDWPFAEKPTLRWVSHN